LLRDEDAAEVEEDDGAAWYPREDASEKERKKDRVVSNATKTRGKEDPSPKPLKLTIAMMECYAGCLG